MFQQEIEYEWEDGLLDEYVELEYEKYAFSSTFTMQHRPFEFLDRGALGLNLHGHNLDVGGDEAYTPGERRMNVGLFTFQEIPLTNRIRLQAGFRLDFQHTSALPSELFSGISPSRNAVNYTGSIGFNHRPVEKLEIGFDYVDGRRFRNGTEYLPFIPPLRLMAGLEYDFGPFWMGGRVVSAASQNRVAPEEDVTDGYTLMGLSAGYRVSGPGNHLIILRVDNLLNQRYRDHLSRVAERNFPMPGRNFSLAYRLFF